MVREERENNSSSIDIAAHGEEVCNLGFIYKGLGKFELNPYESPPNFKGFVRANERMHIVAFAESDNIRSNTVS